MRYLRNMRTMKNLIHAFFLCCIFYTSEMLAQQQNIQLNDSTAVLMFSKGNSYVNKCTPIDHLKCVYITGVEVIEDGLQGKATRHWWRKSYIGHACTEQYGNTFGNIFEGFFAVPHYFMIAIVNGSTWVISLFRPSLEKKQARAAKRVARREKRKLHSLRP